MSWTTHHSIIWCGILESENINNIRVAVLFPNTCGKQIIFIIKCIIFSFFLHTCHAPRLCRANLLLPLQRCHHRQVWRNPRTPRKPKKHRQRKFLSCWRQWERVRLTLPRKKDLLLHHQHHQPQHHLLSVSHLPLPKWRRTTQFLGIYLNHKLHSFDFPECWNGLYVEGPLQNITWFLIFGCMVHESRFPFTFSPKVLDKVMTMWKDGLVDGDVAMQILKGKGQQHESSRPSTVDGKSDETNSKKRTHEEMQPEPEASGPVESVDEILAQAEKTKLETCQYEITTMLLSRCFLFQKVSFRTTYVLNNKLWFVPLGCYSTTLRRRMPWRLSSAGFVHQMRKAS